MIRLLIVDDEPTIRAGIRHSIPWADYGVQIVGDCGNGREALELLSRLAVDVALVDIVMPHLDGLELCERAREQFPALHLVIVSGHENFSYAQRALRLGIDDYLLKPVSAEQLIATIAALSEKLSVAKQSDVKQTLLRATGSANPTDGSSRIARIVVDYIESTYLSEPRLTEAAESAGITPNHLCRVLKRVFGSSFVSLVQSYRIEIAKVLLCESNLKIYEVADRAGFSDYRYFSRVFKRVTSISPIEYRNRPA